MSPINIRIVFTIDFMVVLMGTLHFAYCHRHKTDSDNTYQVSKAKFLLPAKVAKSFLKPSRRVRRDADPTGECNKGCEWEELEEYFGNNPETIREFMREFKCGLDCQDDSLTYCEVTSSNYEKIDRVKYRCSRAGGWGTWKAWGVCSVTCGTGINSRSRVCDNPAQMGGGADCVGDDTETTSCVLPACPVDGSWGSWKEWGACSVTCESGMMYRNRTCDNPAPSNGGTYCTGAWQESKSCTLSACPVHGGWTSWKSWSACAPVNNNVTRTRCRTCTNPTPEYGGDACPRRRMQSEYCNIPKSAVRRPCRCPISRVAEIKNISAEELVELVKEIKIELGVDVSKLSKTIGKKVSAKDTRVSTKAIGAVGTIMLIIPFAIIIGLDLVSVYRYFKN